MAGWPGAESSDTLCSDLGAASWAELATALADARVPLEVGDVAALRCLVKLEPELVSTIVRWLRTARPAAA
ncbi:hypothetical protein [Kitasatospora sp. NBC_01266]|uniref:hypothetical protein n=1 Tax=Kitasatospora sp. NBC_01266 TaxID=2903572 RepID=UPI002E2EB2C9|nr:hypothetical protein [Kitasatospora sp. NBC_01266]